MSDPALRRLLEKIARALGHDLRTPLGTITNCAALLDGDVGSDEAALREVVARIRRQAAAVVDEAQLLSDALKIAAQPGERRAGEPLALLREIASGLGADVRLRDPTPSSPAPAEIAIDPRLVAFAWRAFFAVERSVRGRLPAEAELRVARAAGGEVVELGFDGALAAAPPFVDPTRWVGGGDGDAPPIPAVARLALELAGELLALAGGALDAAGAPGRGCVLRLRLPSPGAAARTDEPEPLA
jgi:hypothetical protein